MRSAGHNERPMRLDMLAEEARQGLKRVEQGEENTIGGWLAYGHALNEGRALFPGDREFGEWIALCQLDTADRHDRVAAMWAAANADQFEEARQRGNPRTIRGIHAKWKEIEAEREAERFAEQQRQAAANKAEDPMKRADTAKNYAEEKAKQEADAKAAVDSAEDGEKRKEAEARAAQASADREAADKAADEAIDDVFAEQPETAPDPYGYADLTNEALLDLANGLRADLEDEKAKRKAAEAEAKALKARVKDLEADDKNEVVRRLQAEVKNAGNAKWKALEDRDAYHRQAYALKKRVAELEKMGIQI